MAEPVLTLNLDTLVEHRVVRISGVDYELRNVGEFGIVPYHQITKRAARVQALIESQDLTDEGVAEVASSLDWLCRLVLTAPDDIHVRLTDAHRLAIIQTFSNLQRGTTAPATEETVAPSTGASTSQGSSASTEARRSTGSPKSRKRSSGHISQ